MVKGESQKRNVRVGRHREEEGRAGRAMHRVPPNLRAAGRMAATMARQMGFLTILSNVRISPPSTTTQPPTSGENSSVTVTSAASAPRMSTSGASCRVTDAAPLQRAYGGHGQVRPSTATENDVPLLHLSGDSVSSQYRDLLDVIGNDAGPEQLAATATVSDGVRANNAPEIEAIASNLRRSVESRESVPNSAEFEVPELLSPLSEDSDSDFEPVSRRRMKLSRPSASKRRAAHPSNNGAGQSSAGVVSARQKTSTAVRATPMMDAGTSILRNLLEGPSTLSANKEKVAVPAADSRKRKSAAGRKPVKKSVPGSKDAAFRAHNAALELGCSRAALPAPRPEQTPIVNPSADSGSDSESEFQVFSQLPQRHIFKRCFMELDVIERERRQHTSAFEEAQASVRRSEQEVERLQGEQRRIQEEIRRLQNEERRVAGQLEDAERTVRNDRDLVERRRSDFEKSTKKLSVIRNRLKRLGE